MHTIQLTVEDKSLAVVMTLLSSLKTEIVHDIKVLDEIDTTSQDPYFDARKKELHQLREEMQSGNVELLSEAEYNQEIEAFFDTLEK